MLSPKSKQAPKASASMFVFAARIPHYNPNIREGNRESGGGGRGSRAAGARRDGDRKPRGGGGWQLGNGANAKAIQRPPEEGRST